MESGPRTPLGTGVVLPGDAGLLCPALADFIELAMSNLCSRGEDVPAVGWLWLWWWWWLLVPSVVGVTLPLLLMLVWVLLPLPLPSSSPSIVVPVV